MGFSLPQTFSNPSHPCSLSGWSQLSAANGVTSLQVSADFTSLSSLLNLLRGFLIPKPVFSIPLFSKGAGTALEAGWAGPGAAPHRCWPRAVFALLRGQLSCRLGCNPCIQLDRAVSLPSLGQESSSSQERVNPGRAFGILCWGEGRSFVCFEAAGRKAGRRKLPK